MMTKVLNNHPALVVLLQVFSAVAVGAAAITHQSFWMDEGSTIFKALIPNLSAWWKMTLHLGGSDVQMPVYMFMVWAWDKLGASSEYMLRAINIPWLVLGTLVLRKIRFWPLVFLTSPFIWYYVGELRPYAMQAAAGACGAAALIRILERNETGNSFHGLHLAASAALLLCASSLTSAIWAAGLWIGVLILKPQWLKKPGFWVRIAPWASMALVLGVYYAYTILEGYRATANEGGILSVLFGIYELSGFAGLGPGRNELRSDPAVLMKYLPVLIPAAICIGSVWLYGASGWLRKASMRSTLAVCCAVVMPLLLLTLVGFIFDLRVLGRHLSPALPAVLLPLASGIHLFCSRSTPWKLLGFSAIVFLTISSLNLRLAEVHKRDDYRRASELAFKALEEGKSIWWQADMNATRYYAHLKGGMPLVNAIQILESSPPTGLMFADLVVINRPDLRFKGRDYQGELKRNYFKPVEKFTGFEVWSSE